MKINIMTWNTAITEKLDSNTSGEIIDYIKKFLLKENAIVFLQQMVYKEPEAWKKHEIYTSLINNIGESYDVKFYEKSSFMMTAAIAKKGTMKSLDETYYSKNVPRNREIAVEFNGIAFLSIHAQNGSKNIEHLKALRDKADVILGDFNAGNYMESENRDIFNGILRGHICICNMPTKVICKGDKMIRKSCIDHIFVRENLMSKFSNLIVQEDIDLSDHYPITVEMNIE